MSRTATDPARRRLLQAGAATLAAWLLPAQAGNTQRYAVLGAWSLSRTQHRAGGLMQPALSGLAGGALPARGHHLEPLPGRPGTMLVFARRPGQYIARVDWQRGQTEALYEYPEDRHGFGHGLFGGGRLFTTDSNIDTGNGLLTLRDGNTLQPMQEWPSGGIGPHELLFLSDHTTLAVANGGILTLPESGRIKLNRQQMAPNLSLIDSRDGKLLGQHTLADKQLSIRHLALLDNGALGVALQYEGTGAGAPVAALLTERDGLRVLDAPAEITARLQGYAASTASDGRWLAVSCPKGDAVLLWDDAGRFAKAVTVPGASGLAATPDGRRFVVSNEAGGLFFINTATLAEEPAERLQLPVKWDNHLRLIAV